MKVCISFKEVILIKLNIAHSLKMPLSLGNAAVGCNKSYCEYLKTIVTLVFSNYPLICVASNERIVIQSTGPQLLLFLTTCILYYIPSCTNSFSFNTSGCY